MKIIVAPNSFKGSVNAGQAAQAILRGIRRIDPVIEVECLPVSDGGDGLVEVLAGALRGEVLHTAVADPLLHPVNASFGYDGRTRTAIIEMAKASGLVLVPPPLRNPLLTTTLGTGELIRHCLDLGARRIILGLGGSATCDGGIGAASALGYRFLDKAGRELPPVGESLSRIAAIATEGMDSRLFTVSVEALCDVANPLSGQTGAAHVYAPQKGADDEQVKILDAGLRNLAMVIHRDLGFDVEHVPGAGAAGGMGAGVVAFLRGRLQPGIEVVIDLLGLRQHVIDADLVITGEGRIDGQSRFNKAPVGVARVARSAGVPCIAICGSVGEIDGLHGEGIDAVFSLCREPLSLDFAVQHAENLLEDAAEQVVRFFLAARKKQ